jgi:aminobenzoyl-glutamate utilization protein B
LPEWSADDQLLARAVQKEVKSPKTDQRMRPIDGLDTRLDSLTPPEKVSIGGGSDDIADISWNVPTVVLRYPSNIPGLPGHNWANAISMATPIAHKGVTAGAKAEALTLLDMFVKPEVLDSAWAYYKNVQTKDTKYISLVSATDKPAIDLNKKIMAEFRPEMKKYYYHPDQFKTYLDQLGIKYPTLKPAGTSKTTSAASTD